MLKAYKYRIYPTKQQKTLINNTFGCVRFFWNKQVEIFKSYNKENNPNPEYKKSTLYRKEYEWMNEVSASAIQQKEIDFKTYRQQKFSKTRKGKIGFPSFKKKSNRQSYRLPNQKFYIKDNRIRLEKIGKIKMVIDRSIPGNSKFMSVTISKNPAGQYFASVLVETGIKKLIKTGKIIGIDVGLKEFATLSDNTIIHNPRYFRDSQAKLAQLQKFFSRKVKGSKRRDKFRLEIARLHNKIANQRDWFLHNESIKIVRNYDVIKIENLSVSGMVKNHKLAKSISDASFAKFFTLLEYKSKWYDKELIKIDRFFSSSKTCSNCGWINKDLTLKDRVFVCPVCGLKIDRDLNAANNIKAFGVENAIRTSSSEVTKNVEMSKVA
jgi:putative transposase